LICLGDGGRLATRADVVVDKPLELLFNGSEGVGMNLEGVLRIALVDISNITSLRQRQMSNVMEVSIKYNSHQ
jgi:hypothetical protein